MTNIRSGNEADIERVNDFYARLRRNRDAQAGDFMLLAENEAGEVVGAVRLCEEQGYHLLRGMLIDNKLRGQGIGRQMLLALEPHMRDHDYYCMPFTHLTAYYGTIGFEVQEEATLPDYLRTRLAKYQAYLRDPEIQRLMQRDLGVYPPEGLAFLAMKRLKG